MTENMLGTNVVCQVAMVVRDIDAASAAWAAVLGVPKPPARLTAPLAETDARFRGQPTDARAKLAFFDMGQVNLELIEPVGRPSTWGEFLDTRGEGLHHIAFRVKGMDEIVARLEAAGLPAVQRGNYTGGRYAYIDSQDKLKAILELLENTGK